MDGFNFIPGKTDSIAPPISVPPERFMIGILPFPTLLNNQNHDSLSKGSPVVGIFFILSNEK